MLDYAPWSGYIAKMFVSDVVVFLDDAQLPQDRRNVSRTKTGKGTGGEQRLTVSVSKSGSPFIDQMRFACSGFTGKHRWTLSHTYARMPYLEEVLAILASVYHGADRNLAPFDMHLIRPVAGYLGRQGDFAMSGSRPAQPAGSTGKARAITTAAWTWRSAIIHQGPNARDLTGYADDDV